jgi:DNA polymerase I-like protein with 3'-5' exonuclease and polymerase domains
MDIEQNKLNLNLSALNNQMHKYKVRRFKDKLTRISRNVSYNLFGTVTGRLTTKKGSFPILTLDRDYRSVVVPNNDFFLELDFNGAELRLEQPKDDIHAWNVKNVYKDSITREEAKKRIFAWLYNLESKDLMSNRAYDRDSLLEKYFDGEHIHNPFGRKIKCDKFHAINFLIQSTASDIFLRRAIEINKMASDIFLRRAIEINKMLKGKKTKIAGLIHDSMLIDFSNEDKHLLPEIIKTFQDTDFGTFKVNKSIGLNFGNMMEIK